MRRVSWMVVLFVALAGAGCGRDRSERLNIRPPRPGTPASPSDVAGIYRSIHQGVLQLRANESLTLIVPEDPPTTSGTFSLENGLMEVRTDKCRGAVGRYRVLVTGEQEAGKATLIFTDAGDTCEHRRRHLTIDPWVYANS